MHHWVLVSGESRKSRLAIPLCFGQRLRRSIWPNEELRVILESHPVNLPQIEMVRRFVDGEATLRAFAKPDLHLARADTFLSSEILCHGVPSGQLPSIARSYLSGIPSGCRR